MAFILIVGAIRIGNPVGILSVALFVWYMTRFQIKPEEKALTKIFGAEYEEYLERVRRWL